MDLMSAHHCHLCMQVINCFGSLSNSELLRRYGFVEADPNPHDCAEIALADVLLKTGHGAALQAAPCSVDRHSNGKHHPCAGDPSNTAAVERLAFLRRYGLMPGDGWYTVSMLGAPCMELVEAVRLCLLSQRRFSAFAKEAAAWRVPRVRPLSRATGADAPGRLAAVLRELCSDRLLRLEDGERRLAKLLNSTLRTEGGQANAMMSAGVRQREAHALCACMQWVQQRDSDQLMRLCAGFWQHPRTHDMQ